MKTALMFALLFVPISDAEVIFLPAPPTPTPGYTLTAMFVSGFDAANNIVGVCTYSGPPQRYVIQPRTVVLCGWDVAGNALYTMPCDPAGCPKPAYHSPLIQETYTNAFGNQVTISVSVDPATGVDSQGNIAGECLWPRTGVLITP